MTPDSQPRDGYAWATNQAGHSALVGMPLALAGLALGWHPVAVPVIVGMIYACIWEWVAQHGADWRDSIMDTACVMAGASIICGAGIGLGTAMGAMCVWLMLIAFGVWQRAN